MNLHDNKYDYLIVEKVVEFFPELLSAFGVSAAHWVSAQCYQESGFDPDALSPVGAQGLMQLMPATDMMIDGDMDGFDPEGNIENGVKYLADQYRRLSEIPHATDRLKAALASYNGGRGYINKALAIGRELEGQSKGFSQWQKLGRPSGAWQTWPVIAKLLASPDCTHNGKAPDHKQMTDYVAKIEGYFTQLATEA